MNLVPSRYVDGIVSIAGHRLKTALSDAGERDVIVGIRPSALRIALDGMKAHVDLIEDLGDTAILDLDCAGTTIRMRVGDEHIPREGDEIAITARPNDIHLFDPTTRKRL
jgi:multiple sugar transport system ATP-binding protein/inositol-phosphate transport system ATP-binding protein